MTNTKAITNPGIALSCAASALTVEATQTAVRRGTGMRWFETAGREGVFGGTGIKLAPVSAPVSRHTYVLNTVDLPTIKQFRVPSPPGRRT
ncbi:hypothetical protein SAMN05421504_11910 [Amycolatopsis xylanica]|uniref:Uncharacterized protein n=1 Tax=Amycolatopsis xylanica TaxID=589385 RepID=A0A1H3T8A0_9PSEU|nr:hypothetical protein [Amycolatopsis xylanica]SDZ46071.1 hypothetical protein SAMN05421504_11910 [Amycolatopsis xylanica]